MREFEKVDHATIFPGMCLLCHTSAGTQIDTYVELPDGVRVYVCAGCAKRLSRVMGFAPGEEMDRLQEADKLLREAEAYNRQMEQKVIAAEQDAASADEAASLMERQMHSVQDDNAKLHGTIDRAMEELRSLELANA